MNVDIKQKGHQSSQLIEIRDKLNKGILITHILHVQISDQPQDPKVASTLQRKIFLKLGNKPYRRHIIFNGQQIEVEMLWNVPGKNLRTSAYYYTSSYLSDIAVALHTKILLSEICNAIRAASGSLGNKWGIAYIISKPLEFLNQPILHGAIDEGKEEDVEDDEEEEV